MNKKTAGKDSHKKSRNVIAVAETQAKHAAGTVGSALKEGTAKVESLFPPGSSERVAAGVAAAAGGALVAAATIGVGPTALAGAAGYAAYRGMKKEPEKGEVVTAPHKH